MRFSGDTKGRKERALGWRGGVSAAINPVVFGLEDEGVIVVEFKRWILWRLQ